MILLLLLCFGLGYVRFIVFLVMFIMLRLFGGDGVLEVFIGFVVFVGSSILYLFFVIILKKYLYFLDKSVILYVYLWYLVVIVE